ncbi:MAG: Zn-dependent alcohol dehydrogenase [Actinomycetota bacterium]|nr:Zn-dependent alcohol dehydrogenase [Actinomycetota bacterium]
MTRAAILDEAPGELVIDDIEVGRVGPHEVLVRTVAAGLCHSDLHFIGGVYPYPLPAVLGHESAGVVEAVGDQVSGLKAGDHVVSCVSGFCGACKYCLTGRPYICDKVGLTRAPGSPPRLARGDQALFQFFDLASFSERLLVHEHLLVKIRPDMPLEKAALIGCGVQTGVGAVINTARVRPGDTVAVIGCGGIGLNAIQAASIVGASRVIAVDRLPEKLDLARTFGATDTVDAGAGDPVAAVQELTGGGVDHSFEAIGLKVTAEQAFAMLGKGGTATVIGMVPIGQRLEIDATQLISGKRLQGSNMGSNRFRVDMPQYVDWYMSGRLKLDELISATMPLEKINDGFAALQAGRVARQLVIF